MENEHSGAILANAALTAALIRRLIETGVLPVDQAIQIFQEAISDLERGKQSSPASHDVFDQGLALLTMGIKHLEKMN